MKTRIYAAPAVKRLTGSSPHTHNYVWNDKPRRECVTLTVPTCIILQVQCIYFMKPE